MLERWAQHRAKPTLFSPHEQPDEWRRMRGLEAPATFGIIASDNVLADPQGRHLARNQLYTDYLPLFRAAAEARRPADDATWSCAPQLLGHANAGASRYS